MRYTLNGSTLPLLHSYAEAKRKYETTAPIRGQSTDIRPLRVDRKDTARMTMDGDDVVFWFHQTAVVRYCPDNTVLITGWSSISTMAFVNGIIPGVHADFLGTHGFVLWVSSISGRSTNKQGYVFSHTLRIKMEGGHITVDPAQLTPLQVPKIDVRRAAQARRESGFNDFTLWQKTLERIDPEVVRKYQHYSVPHRALPINVLSCLARGAEGFMSIVSYFGWKCNARLKWIIYEEHDVYTHTPVSVFDGTDHQIRCYAALRRHPRTHK